MKKSLQERKNYHLPSKTTPLAGKTASRRRKMKSFAGKHEENEGTSVGMSRSAEFHCTLSNPRDFATFNGRKEVKRLRKMVRKRGGR